MVVNDQPPVSNLLENRRVSAVRSESFSILQSPRETKANRQPRHVPPPRRPEVVPHLQIPAQHAVEGLLRALTELTPAHELQMAEIEEDELRVLGVKLGGILGIHCVPCLETTRYQRLQIAGAPVLIRDESQEGVGNNKFFEIPPPNTAPPCPSRHLVSARALSSASVVMLVLRLRTDRVAEFRLRYKLRRVSPPVEEDSRDHRYSRVNRKAHQG